MTWYIYSNKEVNNTPSMALHHLNTMMDSSFKNFFLLALSSSPCSNEGNPNFPKFLPHFPHISKTGLVLFHLGIFLFRYSPSSSSPRFRVSRSTCPRYCNLLFLLSFLNLLIFLHILWSTCAIIHLHREQATSASASWWRIIKKFYFSFFIVYQKSMCCIVGTIYCCA